MKVGSERKREVKVTQTTGVVGVPFTQRGSDRGIDLDELRI